MVRPTRFTLCAFGLLLMGVLALSGCETLSFYRQSVSGQLRIMHQRQPIDDVITGLKTQDDVRAALVLVNEAKRFARGELLLPDTGSFSHYADTGREHVVWNVFATPALSVAPITWCFPVAGCVAYRGYFSELAARSFADKLVSDGFDVSVGGVNAYSTLGWFKDPVLNTFIHYEPTRLVSLIFHELAHQVVYVKGDTTFNESFATFVEMEGLRRWLEIRGATGQMTEIVAHRERRAQFIDLLLQSRNRLEAIYMREQSDDEKLAAKAAEFAALKTRYEAHKNSHWNGYDGYDHWFARELNNAHLVPIAAYESLVPGFERLFLQSGNDFTKFYAAVRRLAKQSMTTRNAALQDPSVTMR